MEALITKEEAAEALKRYTHLLAEIGILASARDKAKLAVDEKYQPGITVKSTELTEIRARLQVWAEESPKVFGEERSVEFSHGWLRFRKGQRKLVLLARCTWDKVLEKLQEYPATSQWREYIRNVPEINKRALLEQTKDGGKLPEAKLRDIGVRVVREESFDIETKPDMVAKDCDVMP